MLTRLHATYNNNGPLAYRDVIEQDRNSVSGLVLVQSFDIDDCIRLKKRAERERGGDTPFADKITCSLRSYSIYNFY